ncbi:haloacid dehalogenase-like hydrolase [Thermodesulfitimonas autotrophica]|uniref:haloacid dehalogenase-like hydrolase n=1 Tax=Thermodesulfitimonas autotrophica TaxID=1894989 RepID=UPI002FE38FCF
MSWLVAFDLEGPLSPQDNAYEVIGRVPRGHALFERLSRYDDLLTLAGREGYEPGDTLKLLVPFLLANGLTEADIREVSAGAALVPGAVETVAALRERGLPVVVISTSYCQHAHTIAARLGIPAAQVACTHLPLDAMREELDAADRAFILEVQEELLALPLAAEEGLSACCDRFFWAELPRRPVGRLMAAVEVVGGARKTAALTRFAGMFGVPLERAVVVGDSITDFKMLALTAKAGGLAIVFNGNEYALPYGSCGVAARELRAVLPLIEAFLEGGRSLVRERVTALANCGGAADPVYHWLAEGTAIETVLPFHKKFRQLLRGEAAKLG